MIFEQIEVGNMQNFSYIIGDEESKEAAIVDAGWEAEKLVEIAKNKGLKINYILLTHTHYDHINSLPKLFELTIISLTVPPLIEYSTSNVPLLPAFTSKISVFTTASDAGM